VAALYPMEYILISRGLSRAHARREHIYQAMEEMYFFTLVAQEE